MFKQTLMIALAATVLTTAPVWAEEGTPERPMKTHPADANGDGFLTKAELSAAHQKRLDDMFSKHDADKDGKMSRDEMKAARKDMRAQMKERRESWKANREQRQQDRAERRAENPEGRGGPEPLDGPESPE